MSPIIHDLWNGNICGLEACGSIPHILRQEKRLAANLEKLREKLSDEQKTSLERCLKEIYEANAAYAEVAFTRGVSLGLRLGCEAWHIPTT